MYHCRLCVRLCAQGCNTFTSHLGSLAEHTAPGRGGPYRREVKALLDVIPSSYKAAALAARSLDPLPTMRDALAVILPRLGWLPPADTALAGPVPLTRLTVKAGTFLQSGPVEALRAERLAAFATAALGAAAPQPTLDSLRRLLVSLWRLRWENANKETYWRLITDSLPRFDRGAAAGAERDWNFWASPTAQAVVAAIAGALGSQPSKAALWLMLPPAGITRPGVWYVVCLAAVAAMDHGARQHARLVRAQAGEQAGRQAASQPSSSRSRQRTSGASQPLPPGRLPPMAARASAVAFFWGRLQDFASLHRRGWSGIEPHLPAGHPPFFSMDGGGIMRVRRPP